MSPADEEIRFHVEMLTRRFVEQGLDPDVARERALSRMGDIHTASEQHHRTLTEMETTVNRTPLLSSLKQDARYAIRSLAQAPLFTITALVTLAVGIGATSAIFSVVHAVLLRDLPYPHADRVMQVSNVYLQDGVSETAMSPEEFGDVVAMNQSFERMAAMRPQVAALTDDCATSDCEPVRVNTVVVSPGIFDLLGVVPAQGRQFNPADGVLGAERVVLLSDSLWKLRYGGDPSVVGRTISLGGLPRVVVGIMPAGIRFPDDQVGYLRDKADLWIPMSWEQIRDGRGNQYLETLALRKPGVSEGQARADLQRIGEDFKTRFPNRYAEPRVRWRLDGKSLREEMVGDVRLGLVILFGAVGCVLLIACANVANLMLARGAARRRELAVRSALGADRRRLVQQLLVETLVVTFSGALFGVGVAAAGLQMLVALNPGGIPRLELAQINLSVLLFTMSLALATGLVVGLLPAFRQARVNPQVSLGAGPRGADSSSARRRLRSTLVVAEVALAVVVLTGSALLIRSYIAISNTPIGLQSDNVAVTRLTIPRAQYNDPTKVFGFHQLMRDRLAAMPGVVQASAVYPLPVSGSGWSGTLGIVGRQVAPGAPDPHAEFGVAMPRYFSTVGIPLVEGREFADNDNADAPAVAIVDAVFAQQYFPGRSPVGERIAFNGNIAEGPFQTIVGVVGHVRNQGVREEGEGQVYFAALQKQELSLFFVTKTAGSAQAMLPSIRAAVREQDPRLPVASLTTMEELVAKFMARDRFNTTLFVIFGVVALAIASVGLYGVLAFLVAQRTREIGIRLALGGRPSDLLRSVIGEGLAMTLVGLVFGLAGAWMLARWMRDMLFEVSPADPLTYAVIVVTMVVVALVAALGPARRATRVDPVDVLRS